MNTNREMDWWIKWFSSIILMIGAATTALNLYPFNMYFQFTGITGWLIVGIMWNDWALIVVNIVGSLILLTGIIHYHFYTDWVLTIYDSYIRVSL
tara:strand:- start:713 stop:997 length:285 start_codon:yes stop_codon:yes gene_type:complete